LNPLLIVLGTRPEAIKLAPIVRELCRRDLRHTILVTGQHTSLLKDTGFENEFHVQHLNLPNPNDPYAFANSLHQHLAHQWAKGKPQHTVIVQGDTASTYGAALAANTLNWPLAHVEAGLRTYDILDPWPEEAFRQEIDRLATYNFAPTQHAFNNLEREHLAQSASITGNTIVDALLYLGITPQPEQNTALVTLHRRESAGSPLAHILAGLAQTAQQHPSTTFTWPIHPNPFIQTALNSTNLPPNIRLRPPMPYHTFLVNLASAKALLTDSGGAIEEAATLGIPTTIARNHSERPEAIATGYAQLAGTSPHSIQTSLNWALNHGRLPPSLTFGDGYAAQRITKTVTYA